MTMASPKKKKGTAKPDKSKRQKISIEVKQFVIEKYDQNVKIKTFVL